jgi:hypothetical protein
MDEALKSPERARALSEELAECADTPAGKTTASVRALCLADLERLAKTYPELGARAKKAAHDAGPEVRRLIRGR